MTNKDEEKKEEKNEDKQGCLVTRLPILTDEEERSFTLNINWLRQLAKDPDKTLVLEARLI